MLNREQICDLLWELGATEVIDHNSNKWIRCTCPVHKEEHPSAGVNVENNVFNCFRLSCQWDIRLVMLLIR